jgi:hypothetical protein
MSRFGAGLLAATLVALSAFPAGAQPGLIDSYVARLSRADHYNSYGERISTAAGVIRQDRANYYVYGHRDRADEPDSFFSSTQNRAQLEAMLLAGRAAPGVRNQIVNGTPLIRVDVYRGYVRVTLLD